MRVIAGTARRLLLKTPAGNETRPTTDRIKETLFNMLAPELPGCRFLDLFSGSGGIGIEALSRGADSCVFVERNKAALACIRSNLETTGFTERATVLATDVAYALRQLAVKKQPFDVIFMDPPYGMALEREALLFLAPSPLLTAHTVLIVETALDADFPYLTDTALIPWKEKRYLSNKHTFFRLAQETVSV